MSNFIDITDYDASIHKEILDSLLRQGTADYDPQIVEICEDRAIAEMRSYLNKKYDCDSIFSARDNDRHTLVLMFAIDIAIFHIFCQHNPYKMSKIRQDRYDRAVEWLKGVMRGDVTIDGAPLLPTDDLEDKSRWQIKAEEIRPVLG
nr:MAG TPA: head to tail adaptor [Caudoviricetes sp.]